jgi:hypothetical protein
VDSECAAQRLPEQNPSACRGDTRWTTFSPRAAPRAGGGPDAVTAYAGLPLVVETMRTLGVSTDIDKQLGIRQRHNGATDSEKAEAIVLLMTAGGTCLSDIAKLRADKGPERLLGRELPSEQILWNYLNAFHDESLVDEAQRAVARPDRLHPRRKRPARGARPRSGRPRADGGDEKRDRARHASITMPPWSRVTSNRPWPTTREIAATNRRSSIGSRPSRSWATSSATAT